MNILELISVTYGRAGKKILTGVDLELSAGTVTALLGPNGAGKTTLLDICIGWKRPTSGRVNLEGQDLGGFSPRERGEAISLVPQHENIRFDFSCVEYVLLGRSPYLAPLGFPGKEDIRIAEEALESAGIFYLRDRPITEMSGGEYQLMLIARSLAQQPKLMLLDEPTSQLDPAHRIAVLRILKRLSENGMTILLTSHSPEMVAIIADKVCLLADGRLAFKGSPLQVLKGEILESIYGVPFEIRWVEGQPQFTWDLQENGY